MFWKCLHLFHISSSYLFPNMWGHKCILYCERDQWGFPVFTHTHQHAMILHSHIAFTGVGQAGRTSRQQLMNTTPLCYSGKCTMLQWHCKWLENIFIEHIYRCCHVLLKLISPGPVAAWTRTSSQHLDESDTAGPPQISCSRSAGKKPSFRPVLTFR